MREIVFDMLMEMSNEGTPSHILLGSTLAKYQYLDKKDRAFISRLFKGVLEYQIYLDYVIGQFSSVRINKMKRPVRILLRMGVYQILKMDSVPDSAACNETVKLAKRRHLSNLSGFINGVLRQISRQKDAISIPDPNKDPKAYLSVTYAMPEWIINRWLKAYGFTQTENMCRGTLGRQMLTLRVRRPAEKEAICASLEGAGIEVQPGLLTGNAVKIAGYDHLPAVEAFAEGKVTVQDESAQLSAICAGVKKGDHIIDVCAAPGGKSLHMADLLEGTGCVDARDLTLGKVLKIQENIERLGLENVRVKVWDACGFSPEDEESADIVMADLPCSGLGVMGRKPDIKMAADPKRIEEMAALQKKILGTVWRYVKKGGVLLYSTCTVAAEENEENRRWILQNLPFSADSLDPYLPEMMHNDMTGEGHVQILPGEYDSDGFYIARFVRNQD